MRAGKYDAFSEASFQSNRAHIGTKCTSRNRTLPNAAPRDVWQATSGGLHEGSSRPGSYETFHKTRQVAFKASALLAPTARCVASSHMFLSSGLTLTSKFPILGYAIIVVALNTAYIYVVHQIVSCDTRYTTALKLRHMVAPRCTARQTLPLIHATSSASGITISVMSRFR